jgi:AraC-like DNA-binding protein
MSAKANPIKAKVHSNWIRHAPGAVERFEAWFTGHAYEPHRHDTYTLAITLQGVQSFRYRGEACRSLPGNALILHPDELHDGWAGTDAGFAYRAITIDPCLIQDVLQGSALPFVEGAISSERDILSTAHALLDHLEQPLAPFEYQDSIYDLAVALSRLAGNRIKRPVANYEAAERAREYMEASLDEAISLESLTAVSGSDRWQLSRDFRSLYGTSPYRYLIMRRLERARSMVLAGAALSEASTACHFSDQSHFTRHFRTTYGVTPRKWLRWARAARSAPAAQSFYIGPPAPR